jgi:hypothetical protein
MGPARQLQPFQYQTTTVVHCLCNNINQTGVNWEDYGEFKGQNTFNDNDNGDFGFGSNRRGWYYFSGDDSPLNNFDGRGFTKNYGGGTNYNFDNKKSKFNISYFYNESTLNLDQYSFRETFLSDNSFTNTDTVTKLDFRGSHSIGTRLEQEIDSNDIVIIKANMRLGSNTSDNRQGQLFAESGMAPTNSLELNNNTELSSWRLSGTAIYRHRFKKKGRSIAGSAGYNGSRSDGTENIFSLNRFFQGHHTDRANPPT